MAEITSAQTGNWSSSSTWEGGTIPGVGDTVVRVANHIITIDQNVTIGDDAEDGTWALRGPLSGNDNGGFILNENIVLTLYGGMHSGGGNWEYSEGRHSYIKLLAGSTIRQAGTHNYNLSLGGSGGLTTVAIFEAEGTAENWCTIENVGSGQFSFASRDAGTGRERWIGEYLRLNNIYTSRCSGANNISYWIWDANCGSVTTAYYTNASATNPRIWSHCTFLNPTATMYLYGGPNSNASYIIIDYLVSLSTLVYSDIYNVSNSILLGPISNIGWDPPDATVGLFSSNFIRLPTSSEFVSLNSPVSNCFIYSTGDDNPHFLSVPRPGGSSIINGCIFEYEKDWTEDLGDCLLAYNNTSYTISNCIELPNNNNRGSGTILSCLGNAGFSAIIHNNTFLSPLVVGESYEGHEGMVSAFYNNLSYHPNWAADRQLVRNDSDGESLITEADYNSAYLATVSYDNNPTGYGSVPGLHDLNQNPEFWDFTRDLAKWAVDILGSTAETETDQRTFALTALTAINDTANENYNINALVVNLINYIREGFTPQNLAFATAGRGDSYPSYIGAVQPEIFASNLTSVLLLRSL